MDDSASSYADRYDEAPCGLISITRRGAIVEANRTFREMVGSLAADKTFLDLLRIGDRIFWETHVGPLLDMEGRVREIAVELRTEDGPLPALLNARTDNPGDPSGRIELAIFPAQDRRSYERELLAARKQAEASETQSRLLAATLQRSLLPPSLPDIENLDVGATYRPAGTGAEVGGDFYDFFRLNSSDWMAVVGDVCGKGAEAAALTALVRYTVRGAAMETDDLAEVLRAVNTALLLDRAHETCTIVLARITPADRGHEFTLAVGGHPLPRLVEPHGEITAIGQPGPLLGALPKTLHRTEDFVLEPGTSLVMFTDGVTEARSGDAFFGEEGLHDLLTTWSDSNPQALATQVGAAVVEYQDGTPRDDVAVVVMRESAERSRSEG